MWFKKKNKEVEETSELLKVLVEYIEEARRLKWTKEEIVNKFFDKKYSLEVINTAFSMADLLKLKLNNRQEVKMARDEEDLEYDEELEETEEEVEEEEEPVKPKKKVI